MKGKYFLLLLLIAYSPFLSAQVKQQAIRDSFFLAKKKGILGKIGRSLNKKDTYVAPERTENTYKEFYGKIIRHIIIKPVGFNYHLGDTVPSRNKFPEKIANSLHVNSDDGLIRKNLFFKEGQKFYPLQVADNGRFLRTLEFLRDALIKVLPAEDSGDSVDVIVLTRDVFSIGGSLGAGSTYIDAEVSEENLGGTGNRLAVFGLYDTERDPKPGYGLEYMARNMNGSFVNWTNGFKNFKDAINSGRDEELSIYSAVEKPMVSRYTELTGVLYLSYNKSSNNYLSDSLYSSDYKYSYLNTDFWIGYNFGNKTAKQNDKANRLRHFVAFRSFFNLFYDVPEKYVDTYNYNYTDINGFLFSYNIYKQNFYRTNFIYGFGRNEDVPQGIKVGVIAGYINKQGARRGYYGTELELNHISQKGCLYSYTVRAGGFVNATSFQDVDLLVSLNHFSKLNTLNKYWYNRNYMTVSYTRQINPFLNQPLFIDSEFGLPYYKRGLLEGEMRTSIKMQSVFYHMKKFLGFRFAPFVFTDLCLLQPFGESYSKTKGYPALGAGVRTRNENLVLGSMELKAFYFPNPLEGMKNWKVEVGTRLQFKYNTNFIRKPDFVSPN